MNLNLGNPITILEYRGLSIPIYYVDDSCQNFLVYFNDSELIFDASDIRWKDDLYYIIDQKLDVIHWFSEYPGAKIEWFNNGINNRDIRLVYKTRTLKIFLVKDISEINQISISKIEKDSLKVLKKIYHLVKII